MISQKELAMSMQITHNGQRILTCRLPRLWQLCNAYLYLVEPAEWIFIEFTKGIIGTSRSAFFILPFFSHGQKYPKKLLKSHS